MTETEIHLDKIVVVKNSGSVDLPNVRGLTKRETEVAILIALGYSNKGISEKLVVEPRTVEHHINSIFRTLLLPDDKGKWHNRCRIVPIGLGHYQAHEGWRQRVGDTSMLKTKELSIANQ